MATLLELRRSFNYDLIKQRIDEGLTREEILKLPEFKGMTFAYLEQVASRKGWVFAKDPTVEVVRDVTQNRAEQIAKTTHNYYCFATNQLDKAMAKYESLVEEGEVLAQTEEWSYLKRLTAHKAQLDTFQRIANLATQVLRLEDQKPSNPSQVGYGAILNLNCQLSPRLEKLVSAVRNDAEAQVISEEKPETIELEPLPSP